MRKIFCIAITRFKGFKCPVTKEWLSVSQSDLLRAYLKHFGAYCVQNNKNQLQYMYKYIFFNICKKLPRWALKKAAFASDCSVPVHVPLIKTDPSQALGMCTYATAWLNGNVAHAQKKQVGALRGG